MQVPEEVTKRMRHHLNTELLPRRLKYLEQSIQQNEGDFLCGAAMTTADLNAYVVIGGILDGTWCEGVDPAVLDDCPRLRELVQRVANVPRVAEWNAMQEK